MKEHPMSSIDLVDATRAHLAGTKVLIEGMLAIREVDLSLAAGNLCPTDPVWCRLVRDVKELRECVRVIAEVIRTIDQIGSLPPSPRGSVPPGEGVLIEQVQQMLGHEKIDTTLIYAKINNDSLKANHHKFLN